MAGFSPGESFVLTHILVVFVLAYMLVVLLTLLTCEMPSSLAFLAPVVTTPPAAAHQIVPASATTQSARQGMKGCAFEGA
jgi:hypothetical protein